MKMTLVQIFHSLGVRTLEIAVRMQMTPVQIFHSFGDVGHQRQLESVVQLHLVVHQYVLH